MERLFSKPKLFKLVAAIALVLGLSFAMGALNTSEALAASSDQTITVSVQGVENSTKTFTYEYLYNADLIDETVHGYLYQKPHSDDDDGDWYVVGAKNSVELTDLFDEAGVSSYWTTGATIMYLTEDYPDGYTKYYTTYEETARDNFFYQAVGATGTAPLTPKVSTPTVLAFDYSQTQITGDDTSADTLKNSTFVEGTRFCCGLDDDTVNGLGTTSMGKRMPTDITGIVIIPASSSSNS